MVVTLKKPCTMTTDDPTTDDLIVLPTDGIRRAAEGQGPAAARVLLRVRELASILARTSSSSVRAPRPSSSPPDRCIAVACLGAMHLHIDERRSLDVSLSELIIGVASEGF